jgi:predicted HicB family RNase H-like nuclease
MKNVMVYREFAGSVHYESHDDFFHGKIEGIDDLITFEGRSVAELKKAFREAVDDYEKICLNAGKSPQKSYRGTFNVRVPPALHHAAARASLRQGLTLNQFVRKALERSVSELR